MEITEVALELLLPIGRVILIQTSFSSAKDWLKNKFWLQGAQRILMVPDRILEGLDQVKHKTSLAQINIDIKISCVYKGVWRMLMVPDWILDGLCEVEHQTLCE